MHKINNLVVGSDGFVGRALCLYLERLGEGVTLYDIKRSPAEDGKTARLDFAKYDRVYWLAWEVGGAKYLYREQAQFHQLDWNLKLMINLFPQLQTAQVPFLFISSQLAECVDTVYGVTKRLGEVWTGLMPQGVRVRLWNVYGAYEDSTERSHVVADFVHQALENKSIKMLTNGSELRQFIHIDDVCAGFHSALSQGLRGVYDVSSFEWTSVLNVATIIAKLTGSEIITGAKAGSTPITPMVGRIPGWWPKVSLEDGLARMVDAYAQAKCATKP